MAKVFDVAAYIIQKQKQVTTVKLQKLVYYSQAWSLVWDDALLFPEEIQAWANGPVVYELFNYYRGEFAISRIPKDSDSSRLTPTERETIDVVLMSYGDLTARQLSFLTHSETPWRSARGDIADTERSQAIISPESMQSFYSSLESARNSTTVDDIDWKTVVTQDVNTLEDVATES